MNKPYIPSNRTEGGIFRQQFCDQCRHDHKYTVTGDPDDACQILNATLIYNPGDVGYPKEWIYEDPKDIFSGTCTGFEQYGDGIKQEPKDDVTLDMFEQRMM